MLTVATLELHVLHGLTIMDEPIFVPNQIQQVLSWWMMVGMVQFLDDKLCELMMRVDYLQMPHIVWKILRFLQPSTND